MNVERVGFSEMTYREGQVLSRDHFPAGTVERLYAAGVLLEPLG